MSSGCCSGCGGDAAARGGHDGAPGTLLPDGPAATARVADRVAPVVAADPLLAGVLMREVEDADGPGLIALVGAAYEEYACGPMDLAEFDLDLVAPATHAAAHARRWWVLVRDGLVLGSVAHTGAAIQDGVVSAELKRLYLAPVLRGHGLAGALVHAITDEVALLGARRLSAWSDTRLVDAHARYRALGFTVAGTSRELHDPAGTTELRFDLAIGSVDRDGRGTSSTTGGRDRRS
jgi:GNAT superfamily N-acetyltransferase